MNNNLILIRKINNVSLLEVKSESFKTKQI